MIKTTSIGDKINSPGFANIISLLALTIAGIALYISYPSPSKVDIRFGDNISLFNYDQAKQKILQSESISYAKLVIYMPVTILNTGGRPEIIERIFIEITDSLVPSKKTNLLWSEVRNADGSVIEAPTPILINPNSSEKHLIGFGNKLGGKFWIPECKRYKFKITTKFVNENNILEMSSFDYSFTKEDSLKLQENTLPGSYNRINITPKINL